MIFSLIDTLLMHASAISYYSLDSSRQMSVYFNVGFIPLHYCIDYFVST